MGSLNSWNPYHQNVQGNLQDGKFLNAAFALIAAGPPRLAYLAGASGTAMQQLAQPIGLVQNFALSQNRAFSRIFEIGSERSYSISGRSVGQIGMGRVLYNGWSFLRVLYSHYIDTATPYTIPQILPWTPGHPAYHNHDVKIPAGYENFFINLGSDLFSQPLGLLVLLKDCNEEGYGSFYVEQVNIPSHTLATDAQGVLFQEQVACQYERLIPLKIPSMPLFSRMLEGLGGLTTS